ncbi:MULTISPECIES: hypothetical protein [unclassified Novosphingobium]|uniref:hypothetical protein n=1 Tax=unclassified Novosphingobium TaxID=2644732 RepID=UPI000ED09A0D|nr:MULTISPECIES: hypothetical protein [unclassified Novosphingobium]HCF25567.1 hypothetical protein [Novosphingobium sp.]HQV03855.1 hypothetical protein [Novosphingobium sp.]
MKPIKTLLPLLLVLSGSGLVASAAAAQLGGLGGAVVRNLPVKTPGVPNLLSGPAPISTNIKDAIWGDAATDGMDVPKAARDLTSLPRTPQGGFVLAEGYYRMHAQSYCLHAGTYGPGGGDAYLLAPVKGSAKDAVTSILRNSVAHPEIAQRDIQLLLWAIVARAKFEDLDMRLKGVAAKLLSQKQLATLNRSALSVLTNPQLNSITGGMPGPVRTVIEAESRMRGLLTTPGSAYSDIERVAVLGGVAPRGEGSIDVPANRWSVHPDGYWVRYKPNGYSNTWVEIWVPKGSTGAGKVYDPGTAIAVPVNTSRQRLAQSGRVYLK